MPFQVLPAVSVSTQWLQEQKDAPDVIIPASAKPPGVPFAASGNVMQPFEWIRQLDSDYYRVRMAAYRLDSKLSDLVLGTLSLGALLWEDFARRVGSAPKAMQPVIADSVPIYHSGEDGRDYFRVYLGFVFFA